MADQDLPTIAQIKAASELLSNPGMSTKVVKINDKIAVKYGNTVSLSEAEIMKFVALNSTVPVPEVLAAFAEEETNLKFIVMELVPGSNLETLLPTLNAKEKAKICTLVKNAIDELRRIPEQNYIGGVNRLPLDSAVFWTPDHDPTISGPFDSEADMIEGMLKHIAQNNAATYVQFLRDLINDTLRGHKTVFTHGDLQPKNIMVNRISSPGDLESRFEIHLVDWEAAAWYPEYWEFCISLFACRFRHEWLELARNILQQYHREYLMMQVIFGIAYC